MLDEDTFHFLYRKWMKQELKGPITEHSQIPQQQEIRITIIWRILLFYNLPVRFQETERILRGQQWSPLFLHEERSDWEQRLDMNQSNGGVHEIPFERVRKRLIILIRISSLTSGVDKNFTQTENYSEIRHFHEEDWSQCVREILHDRICRKTVQGLLGNEHTANQRYSMHEEIPESRKQPIENGWGRRRPWWQYARNWWSLLLLDQFRQEWQGELKLLRSRHGCRRIWTFLFRSPESLENRLAIFLQL